MQHFYAESEGRASEKQVEALRKAAESGEMSYVELEELLLEAFACMSAAGVDYLRTADWNVAPGVPMPTYMTGEPDAVAQKCVTLHYEYASLAFQQQPAAIEALDAAYEEKREAIVACLRAQGREVEDDLPMDELLQETNDAWHDLAVAWEQMGSPPELEPGEDQICRPHIEF